MTISLTRRLLLAAAPLLLAVSTPAAAQEWPFTSGDFWDVGMIDVKDGGDFQYAQHLATKWKDSQEFAKSKGWIKDYMILYNYNPREGEPDIYLISVMDRLPTGPDSDARAKQFEAWSKASAKMLSEESGNRAQYRTLMGSMLLQQAKIK
ncbi:hypothetical protein [Sphingomonas sp. KC8]|uniref:hypothetical protein n=1 Tax=Sphingomonas sp. KC8 TaxID=1030157 RepID=UPI0002488B1D|nr:hypothetical protein [Sphingomonas sp. KC8]ARS29250.1 hypothetical protein KC8_18415 [Sphingomonas sp. KC8]